MRDTAALRGKTALQGTTEVATRSDRRHQARRPRRMGLCSEVADGGEILKNRPALSEQLRAAVSLRFSWQIARHIRRDRR